MTNILLSQWKYFLPSESEADVATTAALSPPYVYDTGTESCSMAIYKCSLSYLQLGITVKGTHRTVCQRPLAKVWVGLVG